MNGKHENYETPFSKLKFKRMTDQERKQVERLTFTSFGCGSLLRNLRGVALGIFLIWFGHAAIDRGEGYVLGLYVVVASRPLRQSDFRPQIQDINPASAVDATKT